MTDQHDLYITQITKKRLKIFVLNPKKDLEIAKKRMRKNIFK